MWRERERERERERGREGGREGGRERKRASERAREYTCACARKGADICTHMHPNEHRRVRECKKWREMSGRKHLKMSVKAMSVKAMAAGGKRLELKRLKSEGRARS